jgi:hypothetical protein
VCEAALRSDRSGLLVSVSRGISQAKDMKAAAKDVCDVINASRKKCEEHVSKKAKSDTSSHLLLYQSEFISFAIANKVLEFGSFKLKSGRMSPYFFNAGRFCSGESLHGLSRYDFVFVNMNAIDIYVC